MSPTRRAARTVIGSPVSNCVLLKFNLDNSTSSRASSAAPVSPSSRANSRARVIVVDDDDLVREAIRAVLEDDGRVVETYSSCKAFLEAFDPGKSACLLIDAYLPGMSGLELLEKLHNEGHRLPAIMITGNADVPMAVQAMKAGALDFIEKPIGREELTASIERALELSRELGKVAGIVESQRQLTSRVSRPDNAK